MISSTLALLNRSLREDTRLLRSHAAQFLFVGIIYLFLIEAQNRSLWFGAPGLWLFWWICWINFWFILMVAASFFATAITEEKEERTLGLLRMAGISPVALLLGKSTSRLVSALMLLSVQFPFALLAVTLGGVTPHQVLATYVALAAFMIFAANVALFCSVVSTYSRKASWMTALLLGFFLFGPGLIRSTLTSPFGPSVYVESIFFSFNGIDFDVPVVSLEWFVQLSVFNRLGTIVQTGFADSVISAQVVGNLAGGLVFFVLSWLTFDLFVRDETPAGPARGFLKRRTSRGRFFGASRVWRNALMWKDFHFIACGMFGLIAKFVLYGLLIPITGLIWGALRWNGNPIRERLGNWTMSVMMIAIMVELVVLASRIFHEETKWKTLPALMMLPLSTAEVCYAKAAGCLLGLLPATCYFCFGFLLCPEGFVEGLEMFFVDGIGISFFMQYLFFVHLVVFVSLYMKWGATLGAFVIVFCLNACCIFLFAQSGPGDGIVMMIFMMAVFGCVMLQVAIGERLRVLAAE